MSDVLLDPTAIGLSLRRIAAEIVERGRAGAQRAKKSDRAVHTTPVLVAIRRGGDPFAKRIAAIIGESTGEAPPVGAVDITLYRDDAATALPNPRIGPSRIPVSIEGRWVVLVDDVISTGRTIRAALDALLDFGRPARIELVALVDRGGRELPIEPTYCGLRVQVERDERVEVMVKKTGPGPDDEEPWAILVPPSPGSRPGSVPPEKRSERERGDA
jgi:pyrimidine operon attenuation protein/uracil phosphoribosyltransferase